VRAVYVDVALALVRRTLPTHEVTARVRLTKSAETYLTQRTARRELPYEAMLAAGRTHWEIGERVRVYRGTGKRAALWREPEERDASEPSDATDAAHDTDPRDYDVEHYLHVLRDTFAARLERALTPEDFHQVVDDPRQGSLFASSLADARPILTILPEPLVATDDEGDAIASL
jgi:hypothetical protein